MRLGQLARKLALRHGDIVDFLAENNIRIADGTNTRLENDHVSLIMKRFVPGWTEAPEVEPESEEEEILKESVPEELISEQITIEDQDALATDSVQEPIQADETNEVIRAPKIELSGLKVIGKIDLPDSKKKEELPKEEGTTEVPEGAKPEEGKRERRDNRRQFDGNKRRHQRTEKNPIALQREKEAKEAQKQQQEQLARDKEKRTQKYLKNYKPSAPTKAVKMVKEEVVEMTAQELAEPPKTLFGKILRWLTKAS